MSTGARPLPTKTTSWLIEKRLDCQRIERPDDLIPTRKRDVSLHRQYIFTQAGGVRRSVTLKENERVACAFQTSGMAKSQVLKKPITPTAQTPDQELLLAATLETQVSVCLTPYESHCEVDGAGDTTQTTSTTFQRRNGDRKDLQKVSAYALRVCLTDACRSRTRITMQIRGVWRPAEA